MYVCVCLCECVCVCVCVYINMCIHFFVYIRIYICIYLRIKTLPPPVCSGEWPGSKCMVAPGGPKAPRGGAACRMRRYRHDGDTHL